MILRNCRVSVNSFYGWSIFTLIRNKIVVTYVLFYYVNRIVACFFFFFLMLKYYTIFSSSRLLRCWSRWPFETTIDRLNRMIFFSIWSKPTTCSWLIVLLNHRHWVSWKEAYVLHECTCVSIIDRRKTCVLLIR